jgi:hypothetical protein
MTPSDIHQLGKFRRGSYQLGFKMFGKRRSDSNDDIAIVRATRLRRFDASSSGQRIVRYSAPPSCSGMAGKALGRALSNRTPSAGISRHLESLGDPLEEDIDVPSAPFNGSSNGDIDE